MTIEAMLNRLQANSPPCVNSILERFFSAESLITFIGLIDEFLPEHKTEILKGTDAEAKILTFTQFFNEKYFELAEFDYSDGYDNFIREIPLNLEGISWDQYDNFTDFSDEWQVMLALVKYPFYPSEGDGSDGSSDRVPVMDAARNQVGDIIAEIPAAGFSAEDLHKKLDGTPYEGMAVFADWATANTGVTLLNCAYEDGWEGFQWDKDTINNLKEEDTKKREIQEKILKFEMWLHEDIRRNFTLLVRAIIPKIPKEQLHLPLEEE